MDVIRVVCGQGIRGRADSGRKLMGRPKSTSGEARSFGVYLTLEQQKRLDILAFLLDTTRSELVRKLVQCELERHAAKIDQIIAAREEVVAGSKL